MPYHHQNASFIYESKSKKKKHVRSISLFSFERMNHGVFSADVILVNRFYQ